MAVDVRLVRVDGVQRLIVERMQKIRSANVDVAACESRFSLVPLRADLGRSLAFVVKRCREPVSPSNMRNHAESSIDFRGNQYPPRRSERTNVR